jgi:predicted PurR-regulated permease PerM
MHMTSDPAGAPAPDVTPAAQDQAPDSSTSASLSTSSHVLSMPIGVRSLALLVIAVLATIYMVREMRDVLIPIALSIVVYHSLAPFVQRLVRWRVPRTIAAIFVMATMVGGVGAIGWSLSDEAASVVQQIPEAAKTLREVVRGLRRQPGTTLTEHVQRAAIEIDTTAKEAMGTATAPRGVMRVQIEEPMLRGSDVLLGGARNITVFGGSVVLVLVFTLFLLVSADRLKRIVVEVTGPTLSHKKVTVQIIDEIARQVQHFLMVTLLTNAIVAGVTTLVLWQLGLQNAAVWGIAAGVLNTLPYFGPLLATLGLASVALVQFGTWSMVAWVAGSALVITSIEGYFLTPWLQGRSAQMNQVAVFVGILFWSWIWGPIGLLLAIPMTMMVKVICDHVEGFQGMGRLMGE